jgi:hypothetical protein
MPRRPSASGCGRGYHRVFGLPPKRITVNLAPADLLKEGSHFDLPIALGLLAAMGVLPAEDLAGYSALGELGLDGRIAAVAGVLPAAIAAAAAGRGLICPAAQGGEAAWAGGLEVLAPATLLALINHFKGTQLLSPPKPRLAEPAAAAPDLKDIKGQESAKRALEIAVSGGHNLSRLRAGTGALGQRLGQLEHALAHLRVGDPVVGAHQLESLALGHRIALEDQRLLFGLATETARRAVTDRSRHLVEEIGHRHVEHARQIEQAAGTDAIGAALVFLHLLEGQPDRVTELFLAHAEQGAAQPNAASDMDIDWIGVTLAGRPAR